jgi:hypothetical protein
LLAERGLPSLLFWLMVLGAYGWTLFGAIRSTDREAEPYSYGILIGCLGGAIGFFASGIVHYNLGDQEVAMVFYLLMGVGVRAAELTTTDNG